MNEKCILKHMDGVLICHPCLLSKMTKVTFIGYNGRASNLLGLIYSDICKPRKKPIRGVFSTSLYLLMILVDKVILSYINQNILKCLENSIINYKTNLVEISRHFNVIKVDNI